MNRQTVIAALIASAVSIPAGFGAGWFAGQAEKDSAYATEAEDRKEMALALGRFCELKAKYNREPEGGRGVDGSAPPFDPMDMRFDLSCREVVQEVKRLEK